MYIIANTLLDVLFFFNKIIRIRKAENAKLENHFIRFSGLADFQRKPLAKITNILTYSC